MQMQHWDLKFPNLAFQCMTSFNVEAVKSVYSTTIQKTVIVFYLDVNLQRHGNSDVS